MCTVVSVSSVEELSNEILIRFEKLLPKKADAQVSHTMNTLNVTLQRFNQFQRESGEIESRDALSNARIGIFIFTRYWYDTTLLVDFVHRDHFDHFFY